MLHLQSVRTTGEERTHWIANGPAGVKVEWDAEITDDRPNECISWRSLEDADIDNSGSVRFERAAGGRGTIVRVTMYYSPPADGRCDGGRDAAGPGPGAGDREGPAPLQAGDGNGRGGHDRGTAGGPDVRSDLAGHDGEVLGGRHYESKLLARQSTTCGWSRSPIPKILNRRDIIVRDHSDRDLRLRPAPLRRLHPDHAERATSSATSSWAKSSRSGRM